MMVFARSACWCAPACAARPTDPASPLRRRPPQACHSRARSHRSALALALTWSRHPRRTRLAGAGAPSAGTPTGSQMGPRPQPERRARLERWARYRARHRPSDLDRCGASRCERGRRRLGRFRLKIHEFPYPDLKAPSHHHHEPLPAAVFFRKSCYCTLRVSGSK